MRQRYQTRCDSFSDLVMVVDAIECFSQERFLAALHTRNSRSLSDIAAIDTKVLAAIAALQEQHAQLVDFARNFNNQFVTRNNRYFNSAHQLLRKIHSGITQMKSIYRQFTPNSTAAIPASAQPIYSQLSIYQRSPLAKDTYTKPLFGMETYPEEVQRLCDDMERFFKVLRDSLLVCLEVLRQEQYIRRNAAHCMALYHDFKDDNYLRIRKFIHSIKLQSDEFSPNYNPAIDLRQSCATEAEFAQKAFHDQEFDDVCSLAVKELVEEELRGEFSSDELQLFAEDRDLILTVRYIITHFDEYLPTNRKNRTIIPAEYVACLLWWCKIPIKRNLAFVTYFRDTYNAAKGPLKPPSNSAVNIKKRTDWKTIPEYAEVIAKWENVDLS